MGHNLMLQIHILHVSTKVLQLKLVVVICSVWWVIHLVLQIHLLYVLMTFIMVSLGFAGNCFLINFLQILGKCWLRPNILLNHVDTLCYCDVDLFLKVFLGLVINRMYAITHVVKLYWFSVIVSWQIPLWLFGLQGSRKSSTVKCGYSVVRFFTLHTALQ